MAAPTRTAFDYRGIAVALLLGCCVGLSGCSKHGKPAPVGGSDVPPSKVNLKRPVELTRVEQRPLSAVVETVGVIEANFQTEIAAGVAGLVEEVLFDQGDEVDPADERPLVRIDQRRYAAALRLAEAEENGAVSSLNLARDLHNRALQARTGTSEQERRTTTINLATAEAKLEAAQASHEMAKVNWKKSQPLPPYKGRINQRKVSVGTHIEDKTVIATMADLSRLRLYGFVPEMAEPIVRRLINTQTIRGQLLAFGQPFALGQATAQALARSGIPSPGDPEFTVLPLPDRTFRAQIFYLSTVADPSTHQFECKAEIDLRGQPADLRPGYTARIRFPLQTNASGCVAPEEAIRATEQGWIVFVPAQRQGRDGQAEWVAKARRVVIGSRSKGFAEIRDGLKAGEQIVRRGAESLEDGTPIRFDESGN